MNADNKKIDSAFGEIALVKLMDVTTTANTQQVDLDVSAIDFTKYESVKVIVTMQVTPLATALYIYSKINGGGTNTKRSGVRRQ